MIKTTIFLDMDGVIANFCLSALRAHGRTDVLEQYPLGQWDIGSIIGISESQFWAKIDEAGVPFWAELEEYPWTRELIDWAKQAADYMVILTNPSERSKSVDGKQQWLNRVIGKKNYSVLYGRDKWYASAPGTVLIDDNPPNIERFTTRPDGNASGLGVLFPQDWNNGKELEPLPAIKAKVEQYFAQFKKQCESPFVSCAA